METLEQLWSRLGLVARVITLKGRTDREKHARESASKVKLPIEFFFAERHPKGGTQGCFDSHQQVCQKALDRGDKMVFILEDDFEATAELDTEKGKRALRESIEFVKTRNDWDIMYLGVLPNIWFEKSHRVGSHVYRMKPWACTHAMIVSEKYMKEIVTWKFNESGKDAYDWRHRKNEK
jgi:GR25 family glycosyltransferase involved in LPS biosynthesis